MHGLADKHWGGRVAAASLALALLASCGVRNTPEQLVAEAKQFRGQGNYPAAIIQLKNALQSRADYLPARQLLASLYLDSGDVVSAEKEIRKALSLGLPASEGWPILADALFRLGQHDVLLKETAASKDPLVWVFRGNANLALGQPEAAKTEFQRVLAAQPKSAGALIGMARVALLAQDMVQAAKFAEQAVAAQPADADAWIFQGDLARVEQKSEQAATAYAQALALQPNNVLALLRQAHLELAGKQYEAARKHLNHAQQLEPHNWQVMYSQALLDFDTKKYEGARERLQLLLRGMPDNAPVLLLAGAVELTMGNLTVAEQYLKHYLDGNPRNLYARKLMAGALMGQRRPQEALAWLEPALQTRDTDTLMLAGKGYMAVHDFAKATEVFQRASQADPTAARSHVSSGISLLMSGKSEQALAEMQTGVGLESANSEARLLYALALLELKKYDVLLGVLAQMEKGEEARNPAVQQLKGEALLAREDAAGARSAYERALALAPGYFPAVASLAQLDLGAKQADAARRRLADFIEHNPKSVQAMNLLASLELSAGNAAAAIKWLQQASAADPHAVGPLLRLARLYLSNRQPEQAIALAQKELIQQPAQPDLLEVLGDAQMLAGQGGAALESYSKLVTVANDRVPGLVKLAAALADQGKDAEAEERLKKAVALQPDHMEAQIALATIYMRRKNPEPALAIARQLQKQRKSAAAGYSMEGDIQAAERPQLALRAYEQAFAIQKTAPLLIKQHILLLRAGKDKEADERMHLWRKDHPDDLDTGKYLVEVMLAKKNFQEAIPQLEALLRQAPKDVSLLNNLAWSYQQGKDIRALNIAEQAYALDANNPAVQDTLGWELVQHGDAKRGVQLLQKAVQRVPAAVDFRYHLAYGLHKTGDSVLARKELRQAMAGNKAFAANSEVQALLKQLN